MWHHIKATGADAPSEMICWFANCNAVFEDPDNSPAGPDVGAFADFLTHTWKEASSSLDRLPKTKINLQFLEHLRDHNLIPYTTFTIIQPTINEWKSPSYAPSEYGAQVGPADRSYADGADQYKGQSRPWSRRSGRSNNYHR
jgi:hypothetical protein